MDFLTHWKLEVPKRLAPSFRKVRAAIERDDFASPDVKKLTGHPFHRAKLDYDSRLLLQFVEHGGRRACLALELIECHAYDRSRFLRGARVDEERLVGIEPEPRSPLDQAPVPVRYLHPGRAEFHVLDKPLSFDERQAELFRLPLPMVLVGCAGSGKTALTLTKLRELSGEVLYVTQSAYLAESAASLYFAHGYENSNQNVDFSSYRALLEGIEVPRGRPVRLADFQGLFKRHETSLRFTTPHQLFEELRGVLTADARGPLTLEQYQALGVRQSIYAPEQRPAVHAFLAKYRVWLAESQLYDPNLVALEYRARAERKYDAVVVDEVQDMTNAELSLVLASLKNPDAFLICGDANQIVHPNFFSWSKVKSLFYCHEEAALRAPIHVLEVNYRSSRAVCDAANALLKIKNARFGSVDRESTALVRAASQGTGKLIGLRKKDAVLRELNQRTRGSAQVAVIVLADAQKAEARQRFSTPLVFSVAEAKGLEYEAVILYDLVSSERARFREVTEGVTGQMLEVDSLVYSRAKDKGDKSLEVYKFFVNSLYVALTRAVDTVYLVESDSEHPLLGLLGVVCGEDVTHVSARASSLEDWQKEARRLDLQGKQEQADAIRKNILRTTPVPWPVLDRAGFQQAHDRAFAPGSVYNKAKQHLFEFAAFHELVSLCVALQGRPAYRPARPREATAAHARERALGPYLRGDAKQALDDAGKYGLEHRNMMGMTPLMMAAEAGQLELAQELVERGARIDAVDALGRMPIHFALRRAFRDAEFARDKLGAFYELSCPTAIELEADGRRLRLARNQGEFFLLLCFVARFHELYRAARRRSGFTAALVSDAIAAFPRSVVPEERRRRTYWNAVLARAEVGSNYTPRRPLWQRERTGQYFPSRIGVRVAGGAGADESFVPLAELLATERVDPDGIVPPAKSLQRPATAVAAEAAS
ncbi:MAG TPA: ankyrin repeat domain-containing protein [Polyangiaceae bacterium]|nr:ankyrin repeat domain-containing protein [Polyangiaceae bacterium]